MRHPTNKGYVNRAYYGPRDPEHYSMKQHAKIKFLDHNPPYQGFRHGWTRHPSFRYPIKAEPYMNRFKPFHPHSYYNYGAGYINESYLKSTYKNVDLDNKQLRLTKRQVGNDTHWKISKANAYRMVLRNKIQKPPMRFNDRVNKEFRFEKKHNFYSYIKKPDAIKTISRESLFQRQHNQIKDGMDRISHYRSWNAKVQKETMSRRYLDDNNKLKYRSTAYNKTYVSNQSGVYRQGWDKFRYNAAIRTNNFRNHVQKHQWLPKIKSAGKQMSKLPRFAYWLFQPELVNDKKTYKTVKTKYRGRMSMYSYPRGWTGVRRAHLLGYALTLPFDIYELVKKVIARKKWERRVAEFTELRKKFNYWNDLFYKFWKQCGLKNAWYDEDFKMWMIMGREMIPFYISFANLLKFNPKLKTSVTQNQMYDDELETLRLFLGYRMPHWNTRYANRYKSYDDKKEYQVPMIDLSYKLSIPDWLYVHKNFKEMSQKFIKLSSKILYFNFHFRGEKFAYVEPRNGPYFNTAPAGKDNEERIKLFYHMENACLPIERRLINTKIWIGTNRPQNLECNLKNWEDPLPACIVPPNGYKKKLFLGLFNTGIDCDMPAQDVKQNTNSINPGVQSNIHGTEGNLDDVLSPVVQPHMTFHNSGAIIIKNLGNDEWNYIPWQHYWPWSFGAQFNKMREIAEYRYWKPKRVSLSIHSFEVTGQVSTQDYTGSAPNVSILHFMDTEYMYGPNIDAFHGIKSFNQFLEKDQMRRCGFLLDGSLMSLESIKLDTPGWFKNWETCNLTRRTEIKAGARLHWDWDVDDGPLRSTWEFWKQKYKSTPKTAPFDSNYFRFDYYMCKIITPFHSILSSPFIETKSKDKKRKYPFACQFKTLKFSKNGTMNWVTEKFEDLGEETAPPAGKHNIPSTAEIMRFANIALSPDVHEMNPIPDVFFKLEPPIGLQGNKMSLIVRAVLEISYEIELYGAAPGNPTVIFDETKQSTQTTINQGPLPFNQFTTPKVPIAVPVLPYKQNEKLECKLYPDLKFNVSLHKQKALLADAESAA